MKKKNIFPIVILLSVLTIMPVITKAKSILNRHDPSGSIAYNYSGNSVEMYKLSQEINNIKTSEYPIFVSELNNGIIYFTETKKGGQSITNKDFYFTRFDSTTSTWEKPFNIKEEYDKFIEINKKMNFSEIFISINYDIYRVDFKNKDFSAQKINVNSKYIETSPCISEDGGSLYFVSDRKDGFGGKDIWVSERLSNNRWAKPQNLGKEINTKNNEESPFLMSDRTTLYFSSKGHNGIGGYDIFVSTLNEQGFWSNPDNLGDPVNSTSDDMYYIADSYGNMAYYSSDKADKYNQDIFYVKYNTIYRVKSNVK